ncbi:hypothetical protein BO78DRAFT_417292 [Aspergillus sclerotiicarbonarius CBS 121057]|uniref:Uncharacterized protein n=1 Tax=Aspergillus sclerotiicarbonarius (strain CBS 121057 / IBT 28362) TaxID=1448318 RepID=A0A319EEK0_ASPSB|nr:hypothetical protein BO78DRAFT_417292 [Aspergillus sclerotiicarbonarius CBS 121057]
MVFRQSWASLPLGHRVSSAVASGMNLRGVTGGRDLDDSELLRLCGRHHGFHDPWRYDVKKRPITGEPRIPRQWASMACKCREFESVP